MLLQKTLQRLVLGGMVAVAAHSSANAEKRVALVVGNSNYVHVGSLTNPTNDAKLMAETLRSVGFTLVGNSALLDLDKSGFDSAIQNFGNLLQGADVGLFYYAGHGVQVRGTNYLVPVTANPTREADVDFQMEDINLVLRQMEGAGTKLNLLVLDACRNNPFGGRGLRAVTSGLGQMQAPEGTLISFATQPGNVAQDGTGSNSPYTSALAQTIRKPGLGVFDAFNEVGLAVKRATGGTQQPWVSSSPIAGQFYFAGGPLASSTTAAPSGSPSDAAGVWAATKDTTSTAVLEAFIQRYTGTVYADLAQARIAELKASAATLQPQVAAVVPPAPTKATEPTPPLFTDQTASPCRRSDALRVSTGPRKAQPLSPLEECALRSKTAFRECDKCPEMAVVPAGSFMMGSPENEPERSSEEGPQRRITFAKPFAIGRYAVTFAEWDACVADRGCNGYRPDDVGWGRGKRPVINVSWNDAQLYVDWLSNKTGKKYSLPSESEREYATRAGTSTPFWWGASISPAQANYQAHISYNGGPTGSSLNQTAPVDSFLPNPWGLYQVHGNVWEWTQDCYSSSLASMPSDGSPLRTPGCKGAIVKGGSNGDGPKRLRSANRTGYGLDSRLQSVGFRLVRPLQN